ncbi:Protein MS5, partial [Arabidopsis thaliana x Arabidopsis arenosa]
ASIGHGLNNTYDLDKSKSIGMHPELIDFAEISNNLDEEENMTFPMGGDTEDYDKPRVDTLDYFDFDGSISRSFLLRAYHCEGDECRKHTYLALVKLYARAGLHLYNMLNGKNLKLDRLKRFNKDMHFLSSYYITLLAFDPTSRLQETFQVIVDDNCFGSLDFICPTARPKPLVITKGRPFIPLQDDTSVPPFYKGSLPEWPPEDAFNDRKWVYVVNESELQNTDWIYLYLELVICSRHREISDGDLSKLKIVNVAIETIEEVERPNERLNAKHAFVYITFKGLAIGRNSEHVERKAIVRRVINEREGYLSLKGDIWS